MAFSYSLFLVLLLIFPGLCFWAGWRSGERTDFLTPSPDSPGSTLTLFMVVLGTFVGHILGAAVFALQSVWCDATSTCVTVSYDPNIYRSFLKGGPGAQNASDLAIELWFFFLLVIGMLTGTLAYWCSRRDAISNRIDPLAFGWLTPAVQAVKRGDSFVVAYVVTNTSHEGAFVAYEGVVQQVALDADQSVKLIILNDVDRFIVKIAGDGLERIDSAGSTIAQLQIPGSAIANVALEIVQAAQIDVEAIEKESASDNPA